MTESRIEWTGDVVKYAAVIEYSQDKAKVEAARPAHRAYLTSLVEKNQLFASGPFEDGYGAFIIYEADSPEAVGGADEGRPLPRGRRVRPLDRPAVEDGLRQSAIDARGVGRTLLES